MANTLNATLDPQLRVTFAQALTQGTLTDALVSGGASLASLKKTLSNGTGANKAQLRHSKQYSFAPGNTDLDLTSLATDRPPGGNQTFALIQWFILRLFAPATGIKLLVGNYGTNGWLGGLDAVTTTKEVRDTLIDVNQIDGWTVSGSLRYLRINNPGGAAVNADLILVGQ